MSDALIVIPARYGSSRLPGKPLVEIAGVPLLARVIKLAIAAQALCECEVIVATDNAEIASLAERHRVRAVITDPSLRSGSDRCLAAIAALGLDPKLVINLQGDAPFTPPTCLVQLIGDARGRPGDIFTPGIELSWTQLDRLRLDKQATPYGGTTCIRSTEGRALWFSKVIVPAIRNEARLRKSSPRSPVIRHIGVYCYRREALTNFVKLPPSHYEELEGLEQLRLIEADMHVHISLVPHPLIGITGIDSAEDVVRAQVLIDEFGDPYFTNEY